MTPERFSRLLEIYGGDIERWPAEEQAAARRLADGDGAIRQAQQSHAALDAILRSGAPVIAESRIERMVGTVMRRQAAAVPAPNWLPWLLAPRRSVVYVGLFVLGCACNLAMRLQASVGPLDLWFNINLQPPWGG